MFLSFLLTFLLFLSVLEFLLFRFYEGRYTHEVAHNPGFTASGWDVVTLGVEGAGPLMDISPGASQLDGDVKGREV